MTSRVFWSLGCAFALLAVAAGAFGAHALRARLEPGMLTVFETAVRYQMYHAIALLAVAWASTRWQTRILLAAGWCFVGGIAIFSGSLYVLVLSGARWLGMVTPLGGLAFLVGWLLLALVPWRSEA
jgi:uncharacterized membrane protein YgdD (TMEM256/DUF423 family)